MGGESSQPPPPSPTFRTPWRKLSWNDKQDLHYVTTFNLQKEDVKHVLVLLYGPVGAGKSSFIRSVKSTLMGKLSGLVLANAAESDSSSFTKKYETHKIKKDRQTFYPFVFNDLMGLEEGSGNGVRAEDIKLAMEGHIKDGYTFNPVAPLNKDSRFYNPSPSPEDKVHVLVCVYRANVPSMSDKVLQKMKDIREAASSSGIPQLALLTHVDKACPETQKDLENVYKSKLIKKKMEEFSTKLGFPLNCILPVKNYSEEIRLDGKVDALILSALRMILDFGDEYIEYKL